MDAEYHLDLDGDLATQDDRRLITIINQQKLADLETQESAIKNNLESWFNSNLSDDNEALKKQVESLYGKLDNDGNGILDDGVYNKVLEKYADEALLGIYALEKGILDKVKGKVDVDGDNKLDDISSLNVLEVKVDGKTLSDLPADIADIDINSDNEIDSGEIPDIDSATE